MTPPIPETKHSIHYWWIFMLCGFSLIVFGVYVATNSLVTYDELSIIFATMLMISGICEVAFCINNRKAFNGWG